MGQRVKGIKRVRRWHAKTIRCGRSSVCRGKSDLIYDGAVAWFGVQKIETRVALDEHYERRSLLVGKFEVMERFLLAPERPGAVCHIQRRIVLSGCSLLSVIQDMLLHRRPAASLVDSTVPVGFLLLAGKTHCHFHFLLAFLHHPLAQIRPRKKVVEFNIVRLSLKPYASLIHRRVKLLHAKEGVAQGRGPGVGIQFRRLSLLLQSFIEAIQGSQHVRTQMVTFCVAGIQLDSTRRLFVGGQEVPPVEEIYARYGVMGLSDRIIELQCLFGRLLCLRHDVQGRMLSSNRAYGEGIGQTAPGGSIVRLPVDGFPEICSTLFTVARKPVIPSQEVRIMGVGIDLFYRLSRGRDLKTDLAGYGLC